ncbi:MAG: hypothetical protein ACRDPK_10860 [Carbonactinosporaceae bacterium]
MRRREVDEAIESARAVADAVLLEGYVLYPYRASARRAQLRWQFGVVAPRPYEELVGEPSWTQAECLIESRGATLISVRLRFLQVQTRTVLGPDGRPVSSLDVDGELAVPWEEGVPQEVEASVSLDHLCRAGEVVPFYVAGDREAETLRDASGRERGRLIRRRFAISGRVQLSAQPLGAPHGAVRLRAVVENLTSGSAAEDGRDVALRRSLVATHTILVATGGRFLSLADPPEWAAPASEQCENRHVWPVLVGDQRRRNALLCSPIPLADHPQVAQGSAGDRRDANGIDEILSLRTVALAGGNSREPRVADPRDAIGSPRPWWEPAAAASPGAAGVPRDELSNRRWTPVTEGRKR